MLRIAFSVCIISVSIAGEPLEHKYGYDYYPDAGGWLRMGMSPATWGDAELRCKLEGGVLASPTSRAIASVMMATMTEKGHMSHVYTGINALIAKGDYMTVEGVRLSNLSWAAGEPNNKENSEDCLVMNGAGELADVNCWRSFRYFCFKTSVMMSTTSCGTWDSSYKADSRTGSCYKFHLVPRTWNRAAEACHAEQAHLAVINSVTEAQVLKELFNSYPQEKIKQGNRDMVFIGFWDWRKQGEWRTVFGQTLMEAGFDGWADNEPNNVANNEYCGTLHRSGRLNDFPCDLKSVFICEIHP